MGAVIERLCGVGNCGRKHHANGYCTMHNARVQKHGVAGQAGLQRARPGEGSVTRSGYRAHRRNGVSRLEHVLVVERVLGAPLPRGAQVHHVNGDPSDNRHENLVVCPDQAYHSLLHARQRALEACGHADWKKCSFCKNYDDPATLRYSKHGPVYYHLACRAAYYRIHKEKPE